MSEYLNKEITVLDIDNYNVECGEKIPFKATLIEITDYPCYWVKSIITDRKYELYEHQIKEKL